MGSCKQEAGGWGDIWARGGGESTKMGNLRMGKEGVQEEERIRNWGCNRGVACVKGEGRG